MVKQKEVSADSLKEVDGMIDAFCTRSLGFKSRHRPAGEMIPKSDPFDVFVVSWKKSGTTLTQNLAYQLLVGAGRVPTDPEGNKFRDISEVAPLIEAATITGVYDPIHEYSPTLWKTHARGTQFVDMTKFKSGRFICLIRDGKAAARSHLDFMSNWIFEGVENLNEEKQALLYERFFITYFLGLVESTNGTIGGKWEKRTDGREGGYFKHMRSWLDSELPNILFIPFEDLTKNQKTWVPIIGKYLGMTDEDLSQSVMDEVIAKCDKKVMAADSRFNELLISEANGLDKKGGRRVRDDSDKTFGRFKLSEECEILYNEVFKSELGFDNYDMVKEEIYKRNEELKNRLRI